jgi:uncharacterized protein YegL
MLPIVLGVLAAAGAVAAYYLLRRLLRSKKDDDSNHQQSPPPQNRSRNNREDNGDLLRSLLEDIRDGNIDLGFLTDGVGKSSKRLPQKYEPIQDLWEQVKVIVQKLQFFERKVSIQKKVGEESVASIIPTGDIEIRSIENLNQLPQVLTGQLGSDDEIFYPLVATNNLLFKQPIEYVGVFKERYIRPRKTIRESQDVSGSMKGDRIAWSRILNTLLIEKSKKIHADYLLTVFTDRPLISIHADSQNIGSYNTALKFVSDQIRADGGTDINLALEDQLQSIEKENLELKVQQNAQIVLITDGTEGINTKRILDKMKELGVVLHTVVLGVHHQQLQSISKEYYYLNIPAENE